MADKFFNVQEAIAYTGYSEGNLRRILREGHLPAEKVISGHNLIWKIKKSDLDTYKKTRGRRSDGTKAHLYFVSPEQQKKLDALANELGIRHEPRYNPKKSK